jgi:hypothetical protein
VISTELVEELLDMRCQVARDLVSGIPLIIAIGRHHTGTISAASQG